MRTILLSIALCIVLCIALCPGTQAQNPQGRFGAIDGVSIPSKVWNDGEARVCGNLQTAISQAAHDRAKRELGIYASKEEVEARRKLIVSEPHFKGSQAQYRESLQGLVDGLSAVYDRGMDPQRAYQQLAAPHKVIQLDWDQQLALGRDRRQKLAE